MSRPRVRNDKIRRQERREAAESRQEARNARSSQEQLQRLDELLGANQGAKRERERLLKEISQREAR